MKRANVTQVTLFPRGEIRVETVQNYPDSVVITIGPYESESCIHLDKDSAESLHNALHAAIDLLHADDEVTISNGQI